MKNNVENYRRALEKVKLPMLVLDQKWHMLFDANGKSRVVQKLEKEEQKLLARQGKLKTDIKDLKNLKDTLRKNILANMDGAELANNNSLQSKKLEKDRELIEEINGKIATAEDELFDLPEQMAEINRKLMAETMDYCYQIMHANQRESDELAEWIRETRIKLKENVVRKQTVDDNNRDIYAYMHDILGSKLIDLLDMEFVRASAEEDE